jgi:hypothetical protein
MPLKNGFFKAVLVPMPFCEGMGFFYRKRFALFSGCAKLKLLKIGILSLTYFKMLPCRKKVLAKSYYDSYKSVSASF